MMRIGRGTSELLGDMNNKTLGKLGKDDTFFKAALVTPPKDIFHEEQQSNYMTIEENKVESAVATSRELH